MKLLAMLAAVVALAGAPLQAQERTGARSVTAPPDRRVELDFQHYYTGSELRLALNSLAAAYPEFLRLETLGRSAGGRELWVMTVSALNGADPARKPALLLVGAQRPDDLHGVELSLYTILELVQNQARDPALAALLQGRTLYVVPCLDPDLRARVLEGGVERASGVQLDRNFPAGWDAWSARAGAGPYPLSEPESGALARFLLDHLNVSIVQTYSGQPVTPGKPLASPGPYELLEASGEGDLRSAPSLRGMEGSLLAFADRQLGLFALTAESLCLERTAEGLPSVAELFQLGRRALRTTARLADALPQLQLGEPTVQRLRGDVWQVELELSNTGVLPTATPAGIADGRCLPPLLEHEGAQLLGCAVLGAPNGKDLIARTPLTAIPLPDLEGGGVMKLRLIVQSPQDAILILRASAMRAGIVQLAVPLR